MIRLTLLWLFVAFLSAYALKDWFKSLCGLILLMAVVEHPDFPKSLMGIQGLNAWNILLMFVLLGWATNRDRKTNPWDMPGNVSKLLIIYFSIVIVSFIRMALDMGPWGTAAQAQNTDRVVAVVTPPGGETNRAWAATSSWPINPPCQSIGA